MQTAPVLAPFVTLSWLDVQRDGMTLAHVQRDGTVGVTRPRGDVMTVQ